MPLSDDYQLVVDSLNSPAGSAVYSEAPAASYAASEGFADRSASLADQRLNDLRCGTSSGNGGKGLRAWGQIFGNAAHQGGQDGFQGFDLYGEGGSAGIDTANMFQSAIVGASLSYGRIRMDARDPTMTDTDINSYQATLYGDYDLGDHVFMRGLAAYARTVNDTTRNSFGTTNRGSYGANEFSFLAKAGKTFQYDAMFVTPSVTGRWIHYNPADYNETGAGGFHVSQSSVDSVEVGPSVDVSWKLRSEGGGWIVPSVHAGYRFDLAHDSITTTYTGGGGPIIATSPPASQSRINLGTALTFYTTNAWEFKAGYDADVKQNFLAHTGIFRGTVRY